MQLAGIDLPARLLEPVAHQVGAARHTPLVGRAQRLGVGVAQLAAHLLVAHEGRIPHHRIRHRPRRLLPVFAQHRVAAFDVVQRVEHRVQLEAVTALDAPLQLAYPHRHPRQLGRVAVDLDAQHVVRAGHVHLALQAQLFGFQVHLVLDVLQAAQRQVEEVAAAAGRVEHAVGLQPLQEADEGRLRVAPGLVAVPFAF